MSIKFKRKQITTVLGLLCITSYAMATSFLEQENQELAQNLSKSRLVCAPRFQCNYDKLVKDFYKDNKNQVVWIDKKANLNSLGEELLNIIKYAYEDGLNPKKYNLSIINELMDKIKDANDADDMKAKIKYAVYLDTTLTDAFFAYAHDMYYGQINQSKLYPYWTNIKEKINLINVLKEGIQKEDLNNVVNSLRPTYLGYAKLRNKLRQYQKLVLFNTDLPVIPENDVLQLGSTGKSVALLQQRLALTGELDTDYKVGKFDNQVKNAVLLYQYNNGIYEDGIVSDDTLKALNVPLKLRIKQIQLNLDKMRLLPESLPEEYVMVNLPEFSLKIYNNNKTVMKMDVAVGGKEHPSCVLNSKIDKIVLNPYWNIPPSIALEEIFPILKKDPNYIVRKNMEVLIKSGSDYVKVNEPEKNIDWAHLTDAQFNQYRYRQIPGDGNALGKVKFLFANKCGIYLHDSNETEVFDVYRRDFSHGCIRVAEPQKLTNFFLDGQKGWDNDKVDTYWNSESSTVGVNLSKQIDLYIVYFTSWVDDDNYVQFRRDIYNYDKLSNYSVYLPTKEEFENSKMKDED